MRSDDKRGTFPLFVSRPNNASKVSSTFMTPELTEDMIAESMARALWLGALLHLELKQESSAAGSGGINVVELDEPAAFDAVVGPGDLAVVGHGGIVAKVEGDAALSFGSGLLTHPERRWRVLAAATRSCARADTAH